MAGKYVRLVHVSSRHSACLITLIHKRHHLVVASDDKFAEIFDVRSQAWMLTNPEVSCVLGIEQIPNFLVVDLIPINRGWKVEWLGSR